MRFRLPHGEVAPQAVQFVAPNLVAHDREQRLQLIPSMQDSFIVKLIAGSTPAASGDSYRMAHRAASMLTSDRSAWSRLTARHHDVMMSLCPQPFASPGGRRTARLELDQAEHLSDGARAG